MLLIKTQTKGLQLEFIQAPNLPYAIWGDQGKLRQILLNLLGNAIKFTASGYVQLTVKVAHPSDPAAIALDFSVEDTGSGIAPDELATLFTPFQQTRSGLQSGQGSGLGLALCRQYVHLMGGELQVESQLNQGSNFFFTLPFKPTTPVTPQPKRCGNIIGLAPNQPTYRFLIAEDNAINRMLLIDILAPLGVEIREASHGQAALDIWETWQPHLIWMDMLMPLLDGYETTRRIRTAEQAQARPRTVILALTATAFEENRADIIAAGCDDMLRKPFQTDNLFDAMRQHLHLEYVYDSEATTPTPPTTDAEITPLLAAMSLDWLQDLQLAAIQCRDRQIKQLIQQIPPEHIALGDRLSQLVNMFQFDQILQLLACDGRLTTHS